jgi:hypothetical protein
MTERQANKFALFVGHLQKPTSPAARRFTMRQLTNYGTRLCLRSQTVGKLKPLLIAASAVAKAEMVEIAHQCSSLLRKTDYAFPFHQNGRNRTHLKIKLSRQPNLRGFPNSRLAVSLDG